MSAMGSVMLIFALRSLPTGFHDPGDLPLQGQFAETDPAKLETPQIAARAAASLAAAVRPDGELGLFPLLRN
jgi:hypothetical protein